MKIIVVSVYYEAYFIQVNIMKNKIVNKNVCEQLKRKMLKINCQKNTQKNIPTPPVLSVFLLFFFSYLRKYITQVQCFWYMYMCMCKCYFCYIILISKKVKQKNQNKHPPSPRSNNKKKNIPRTRESERERVVSPPSVLKNVNQIFPMPPLIILCRRVRASAGLYVCMYTEFVYSVCDNKHTGKGKIEKVFALIQQSGNILMTNTTTHYN